MRAGNEQNQVNLSVSRIVSKPDVITVVCDFLDSAAFFNFFFAAENAKNTNLLTYLTQLLLLRPDIPDQFVSLYPIQISEPLPLQVLQLPRSFPTRIKLLGLQAKHYSAPSDSISIEGQILEIIRKELDIPYDDSHDYDSDFREQHYILYEQMILDIKQKISSVGNIYAMILELFRFINYHVTKTFGYFGNSSTFMSSWEKIVPLLMKLLPYLLCLRNSDHLFSLLSKMLYVTRNTDELYRSRRDIVHGVLCMYSVFVQFFIILMPRLSQRQIKSIQEMQNTWVDQKIIFCNKNIHRNLVDDCFQPNNKIINDAIQARCNQSHTPCLSPEQIDQSFQDNMKKLSWNGANETLDALFNLVPHLSQAQINTLWELIIRYIDCDHCDDNNYYKIINLIFVLMFSHPTLAEDPKIVSCKNKEIKEVVNKLHYFVPRLPTVNTLISQNPFLKLRHIDKESFTQKNKKITEIRNTLNDLLITYFAKPVERKSEEIMQQFVALIQTACQVRNQFYMLFFRVKKDADSIHTHSAQAMIAYFKKPESIRAREALQDAFGETVFRNPQDANQFSQELITLMKNTISEKSKSDDAWKELRA